MDINKKILKVGLLLIALSLILSLYIANFLKLDNPVFYGNYREIYLYETDEGRFQRPDFRINYLTNYDDNRRVVDIYFKEAPELKFRADGYIMGQGTTYGRYSEKEVYIKTEMMDAKPELNGLKLKNAVVTFSNGDIIETDIGSIILSVYKDNRDFIKRDGASSSSDGTSYSELSVEKDIVLEKLDSPFMEIIRDNIEVVVGGRDYRRISGLPYKSGDRLRINTTYKIPGDIIARFTFVELNLNLYFKDIDGNSYSTKAHLIDYRPYQYNTNFMDIISYLRQRGEI